MENFTIIEKLLYWLDIRVETPEMYGKFHIISVIILLSLSIFLLWLLRKADSKACRIVFITVWAIIAIFEVYKQLDFACGIELGKETSWNFQWYAFPYQFCSTPLYTLPLVAIIKDGKIRDAIMLFLGTYVAFAGLSVMAFPNGIYISSLMINIQTTLHHFSQIFIGMFIAYKFNYLFKIKKMLGAFLTFCVMSGIAIALDVHVPKYINGETFNMFFISPIFESTLPILSSIWGKLPYPIFILLYLLGFTVCAFVIFGLAILITRVLPKAFNKKSVA